MPDIQTPTSIINPFVSMIWMEVCDSVIELMDWSRCFRVGQVATTQDRDPWRWCIVANEAYSTMKDKSVILPACCANVRCCFKEGFAMSVVANVIGITLGKLQATHDARKRAHILSSEMLDETRRGEFFEAMCRAEQAYDMITREEGRNIVKKHLEKTHGISGETAADRIERWDAVEGPRGAKGGPWDRPGTAG